MRKFSDIKDWSCEECGRPLATGKIVWLELNMDEGTYHKVGEVPETQSQGEFPFGPDCAKKALAGTTVNC